MNTPQKHKDLIQAAATEAKAKDTTTKCLYTFISPSLKKLTEIVKVNRIDAKIYAHSQHGQINKCKVFLTTKQDSDYFNFSVVSYDFGVNKNGKIYVKSTDITALIYKNKQMWSVSNKGKKKVLPAKISDMLSDMLSPYHIFSIPREVIDQLTALMAKLPFLNTFKDQQELNQELTYNYAVKHKIFSIKDRITYATGGIKGEKIIEAVNGNALEAIKLAKQLIPHRKHIKQFLYVIDDSKINPEILNFYLLNDTLRMASIFGETVKLRWSQKRLQELHDKMSKTITIKTAELDKVDFTIPQTIQDFAAFVNVESSNLFAVIIENSVDLALHGMEQKHCVATYASQIKYGSCYILSIKNRSDNLIWTAQVTVNYKKQISLLQFRGLLNANPPESTEKDLKEVIEKFNKLSQDENYTKDNHADRLKDLLEDLNDEPQRIAMAEAMAEPIRQAIEYNAILPRPALVGVDENLF